MKARIEILGDINLGHATRVISNIIDANNDPGVDKIILWITSDSGWPEVITPISEIIKMCTKPVYAIGAIRVRNVAASVFMMAEKRVLLPGTSFEISKFSKDKSKQIGFADWEDTQYIENNTEYWKPIIDNSSITLETLEEKCDSIWKLTNDELVSLNVVTNEYNVKDVKSWVMAEEE